jgi:hypothetical protein
MRSDESYNIVFSEKTTLGVWAKIAFILKTTDEVLEQQRPTKYGVNEGFLKKYRQITSFLVISKLLKRFDFSANDLININNESITKEEIKLIWLFISSKKQPESHAINWKKKGFYMELCTEAAKEFSIANIDRVEKNSKHQFRFDFNKKLAIDNIPNNTYRVTVDMAFALKVNELLPPQPWKPGVNKMVINALGCTNKEYFDAVNILIDEGLRNLQRDGVVYDSEGNVICFDKDRVDPDTLELLDEATS